MVKQFLPLVVGILVIAVVVLVLPNAVKYVSKASAISANLVVNYEGVLGQMPTPWRNLAQGGEEPKPMLSNVVSQVKTLRPEYIRIDHIYDAYEVVKNDGGVMTYDWSKLDKAVDEVLATGAKPFFSLSYMPSAISKGDVVETPKNWNDWSNLVKATIEHYSGKKQRNLVNVIYECWNEPDLFGDFKTYGDKNYLTLYKYCSIGATSAKDSNEFELGGPAVTALYQNWVERLIKFVDAENLRMDFVSWHRYDMSIDQFEKDAATAREWASNIPALVNLKYYVTEWGHNSKNDPGYDNMFGAIHTIAGARAMMGQVHRAFVFEIKDGPGPTKKWGRWGMITHENHGTLELKPRYHALKFLNTLGAYRIGLSGEGSHVKGIASTDDKGNIKLMVVNYDMAGKRSEAVPITFDNLPVKSFKYSRRDFTGNDALTKTVKTINIATDSASWKTTELLGPNSAVMLSLDF